ncbi:hypothetical protein SAMN05421736_10622 [Evansella caseinilytica]|uniref:Uncharacterized protein n=1 Tax=Evansella caseinilytica TaxID=1503961 RepID=A0A1H3Q5Q1_9BACI|nr:hypothetical protein SAMN05421736_10622 [Evansella caseinilytica]
MPNSKFSEAFKHEVLLAYEKRECTIKAFCSKFPERFCLGYFFPFAGDLLRIIVNSFQQAETSGNQVENLLHLI